MDRSETKNPVLCSILEQGTYVIVRDFGSQAQTLAKTRALIKEAVGQLHGAAAQTFLEERGLNYLHEVLPAAEIGRVRDAVMPAIRPDLFRVALEIGRQFLGIQGEFFVDEYTILRINYPYPVAMRAPLNAENPGIGRVGEATREASKQARVVDPIYNPRAYHNNEPPPAWAHGPHKDTWTGHSRFGINLWWAVEDVGEENSMVFYPESFGKNFRADPRSLYLAAGFPLPKPTKMALRAGEMLIFNPEMLHGSHLNTSNQTRLALSTRINPQKPTFDRGCFYAREFWHWSANLENKDYDRVLRFEREKYLSVSASGLDEAQPVLHSPISIEGARANGDWFEACPSENLGQGAKLLVQLGPDRVILMRSANGLHAAEAKCPHLDISLMDGFHDNDCIYCPAHAVAFSLKSGNSSCADLRLRIYEVKETEGMIWLRLPPGNGRGFIAKN